MKKTTVALLLAGLGLLLKTARFDEMLGGVHAGLDVISGQRVSLDDEIKLPARSVLILEIAQ